MTDVAQEQRPDRFPLTVRKGAATVKIYEVSNRDRKHFTVAYLTASNGRVRKTFSDFDIAKREAENIASNLAQGDLEALRLTGGDKQVYTAAQKAIGHTGTSLLVVASEFARAWDILGHGNIVEETWRFSRLLSSHAC